MAKHPNVAIAAPSRITREVLEGLRKTPKELSPVWFYDERGSNLFERICELPEYYLTRTELGIMREHAAEMAEHIGPKAAIIELGSGSSLKTRLLLDQLQDSCAYVPVDISREQLLDAAGALARDYPALRIVPICADFTRPFDLPEPILSAHRRVVYFPGSTLGNFELESARDLLASMRALSGGGAVLVGIDLKKDPKLLERAYDDDAGITAQFNLNALRHVNRELNANFDIKAFEHQAVWKEELSRIEMHLVSRHHQTVQVAGEHVDFARGEHLRTECCHKYTLESFSELARSANLHVARVWMDANSMFGVVLLQSDPTQ
jgi:L-histidine N-alpha-methyltransferase